MASLYLPGLTKAWGGNIALNYRNTKELLVNDNEVVILRQSEHCGIT